MDSGTGRAEAPRREPRLFVRKNRKIYPEVMHYLAHEGFDDLVLRGGDQNPLSATGRLLSSIASLATLGRSFGRVRGAEILISAPKSTTVALKIAALLGLVRANRHYCWAYFSHSLPVLRVYGLIAKLLDRPRDCYVVDSQCEAAIYSQAMGVPRDCFLVLPYSDWDPADSGSYQLELPDKSERYFFSGGYSNRDYPALIEVFRALPQEKLVIVCSAINAEMARLALPPNVQIRRDIPYHEFNQLVARATACILPIKNRAGGAGGAGQAVMVSCLKLGTPVLITDTPIAREYIVPGISGYLVDRMAEIVPILAGLDPASPAYRRLVEAGRKVYVDQCSYAVTTARFQEHLASASAPPATPPLPADVPAGSRS